MKNIRRKPVDFKTLRLSPEEGFVLSRLDAPLSVRELVSLTGIDEARVVDIVQGLASQGALEMDQDGGGASPSLQPSAPFSIPPTTTPTNSSVPVASES